MVRSAKSLLSTLFVLMFIAVVANAQKAPPTPAESINRNFIGLNKTVLDMAKDFPADKYDYRPGEGVRSFGEVLIHIASGNVYAAKAGRGEKVNWDELDPKNYKGKDQIVAELEKSINDSEATLKTVPKEKFAQTLAPWLAVIEHEAEHMGQLIAYYRVNGLVPPQSRGQK